MGNALWSRNQNFTKKLNLDDKKNEKRYPKGNSEEKKEELPSFVSEDMLRKAQARKPDWTDEDPFIKYADSLPRARTVAVVSSGLSVLGMFMVWRWNRQATVIVQRYLAEMELAKMKNLPLPKPKGDSGEGALIGFKALGYGTLLSTTTCIALASWGAHFMGVKNASEFSSTMRELLTAPRRFFETTARNSTPDSIREEKKIDEETEEIIALFGRELALGVAEEEKRRKKQLKDCNPQNSVER